MKKRILASLIGLVMIFTLGSCGGTNEGGTVSEKMSNANQMGMLAVSDGWVYGIGNVDSEHSEVAFTASKLDGSEKKVITRDSIPTYVNVINDELYYILQLPEGNHLYKSDLDGNNREKVIKDKNICAYQVVDDTIYYQEIDFDTNTPMSFYKCDINGENSELILEEPGFYPYVVGDKVYYQDPYGDNFYSTYNMKTKKTKKLSKNNTYMLSVDDEYAYGVQCDGSYFDGVMKGDLVKINLETKESETLAENVRNDALHVASDYVYYIGSEDELLYRVKKSGGDGKAISENKVGTMYVYGNDIAYITYDETGFFEDAYTCDYKGKSETKL